jgi:hypothetical protein
VTTFLFAGRDTLATPATMTRRSDLEALLFSLLDTFLVKLPWHNAEEEAKEAGEAPIDRQRRQLQEAFNGREEFWAHMKGQLATLPDELKLFFDAIAAIEPNDVPDYVGLAEILSPTNNMPPKFYELIHTACVVMKNN